jgi:hypothetical protein
MRKPKNLGRLALNKRSGRPRLKACHAQNMGHNRPHAVGFPIREPDAAAIVHFSWLDSTCQLTGWSVALRSVQMTLLIKMRANGHSQAPTAKAGSV